MSRTQMIAAELCLLLLCLLLAARTNAGSCPSDFLCRVAQDTDVSKASVSLSCGGSALNLTLLVGDGLVELTRENFLAFELNCSGIIIDLRCGGEFELPTFIDTEYAVSINYTQYGIQPGDHCSVKGCFAVDQFGDILYNLDSAASECIVPHCSVDCHENARCQNTTDGPQCRCLEGYTGNGTYCIDENAQPTDCSTADCYENASCQNTTDGPQCMCLKGYAGNGTYCTEIDVTGDVTGDNTCEDSICEGASWAVAIAIVVIVLLFALVFLLAVGITVHVILGRRRGLDHKRFEKFMGTFDPNFNPHLSTNLRKVTAQSELSVFDTLWHTHPPPDNDYITMDELGIHVRSNKHARDTDSENSVALQSTTAVKEDLHPMKFSRGSFDASEIKSNFSLDLNTVHRLFKMGHAFQNANCEARGNPNEPDDASVTFEPQDFVEDVLRIDIGGLSETDDERYMSVASGSSDSLQLEEPDFVENAFRIDIDDDSEFDEPMVEPEREYVNVDGGVSFSYPSAEELEPNNEKCEETDEEDPWISKFYTSLPALNHSSSDDSLSSYTQSLYPCLSSSTPVLTQ